MSAPHLRTPWRSFKAGLPFLHTVPVAFDELATEKSRVKVGSRFQRPKFPLKFVANVAIEPPSSSAMKATFRKMVQKYGSFLTYEFASVLRDLIYF